MSYYQLKFVAYILNNLVNRGLTVAGFVVGAKVPSVLTSLGASAEEKYLSLVCSAAV